MADCTCDGGTTRSARQIVTNGRRALGLQRRHSRCWGGIVSSGRQVWRERCTRPGAPCGARSCLTRQLRARRGILMGAGGSRTPRAPPAPSRRARRARAEALKASKGLWCGARYGHGGVRHPRRWSPCVPRRCETLYVTPRSTQSRPTRSARTWWPCWGLPSSQWAPRGVSSSGHALAIDPMCTPRRWEVLYVLLRPTQSRLARSARAWLSRSGRS